MKDYCLISWSRDQGKVKTFSTASGAKATRLTIVLEFTDSYALSSVLQSLHEAQHPPKPPPPPPPKPKPVAKALPAPLLGLPYYGESE